MRTAAFAALATSLMAASAFAQDDGLIAGQVVETMDTGNYTYVRVDTGDATVWAAAPRFEVDTGSRVRFSTELPMADYYSKTLDRTFEMLYFVGLIHVEGAEGNTAPLAMLPPATKATQPAAPVDVSGIERADGGAIISEIFDQKAMLAGQRVSVRGKVVKFTASVMGKNWIHLRDGTRSTTGDEDLTITSAATAAVGDTVVVEGTVAIDEDFGFGYQYAVMIQDASVKVE